MLTLEGDRTATLVIDRDGREEPVAADPASYQEFTLSPDGTRVATESYRGLSEGLCLERMQPMVRPSRYSPEVRERAIRMVREHGAAHPSQWAAIASIAGKLGCTAETLRRWVRAAGGARCGRARRLDDG